MKIAVVTAYCREDDATVARCVESVAKQTVPCRHYLLADLPSISDRNYNVYRHIALGEPHRDYGNTPRGVGSLLAISEGADAICYLDADNTYDVDHIETCLDLASRHPNVDYIVARRRFLFPDGIEVRCRDEDIDMLVDTNCYFLLRTAFGATPQWAMQPRQLASLGDRIFLLLLKSMRLKYIASTKKTVNYTATFKLFYEIAGRVPPPEAKESVGSDAYEWWSTQSETERSIVRRLIGLPTFDLLPG